MAIVRQPVARIGSAHVPLATADVISFIRNYRESSAATTVAIDDDIVAHIGAAVTYTLPTPAAAGVGRMFSIINQGTGAVTLSQAVRTTSAATVNTIAAGSSLTFISSGTQYRRLL